MKVETEFIRTPGTSARNKKRVLLVNPPVPFLAYPDAAPHLGIGYLAAYLRENHVAVDYANYETSDPHQIEIPEGYDYYGFTAVTPQYYFAKLLLEQVRKRALGQTIIGGAHASVMPETCRSDGFDYVVKGYGEIALLGIVNQEQTPGIIQGVPVTHPDELPFPAWDLLYQSKYDTSYGGDNSAHVFSVRGCPYDCFYCCSPTIYGAKVWFRDVKTVVQEIKTLKSNFNVNAVYFFDPTFTLDRHRTETLVQLLKELNIDWTCQTRVDRVDADLLAEMKATGCNQISFGIEAGSSEVHEKLGKKTTTDQNALAIKMAHDAGMKVKTFLMGALPEDQWPTNELFKEFISRNRPDSWLYSTFIPFPGTDYWNNPQRYGIEIVRRDFRTYYPLGLNARGPININNRHLDRENLQLLRDDMLNFLRKELPNPRVEEAIRRFPKQRVVFEQCLQDMDDVSFMFGLAEETTPPTSPLHIGLGRGSDII